MPRDDAYLLDILLAARKACHYMEGLNPDQFQESELHQDAVIRALEIIGEAARRVSPETRAAHPTIPWEMMIGMRNRLMHEYFRINLQTVWDTVQDDLPSLITLIEPLVPPDDEDAPTA